MDTDISVNGHKNRNFKLKNSNIKLIQINTGANFI